MRIALLALEALPNARALRRFVEERVTDLVLVGLSDPMRANAGGVVGQVRRHLQRSGPRILPYLAVNFGLPDLLAPAATLTGSFAASGRKRRMPLARSLRARNIPCVAVSDVNGVSFQNALREAAPDLIVTFHFDQILAAETIALARLGAINVHPALLPRHRGPAPTVHALAEGGGAFGVTVHRTVPTIDAGAILAQSAPPLPAAVTATRAARLLHDAGLPLLCAVLDEVAIAGRLPEGRETALMPYRPWPDRALLATMAQQKKRLVDAADLAAATTLFFRD